jgi:hypothetical protein
MVWESQGEAGEELKHIDYLQASRNVHHEPRSRKCKSSIYALNCLNHSKLRQINYPEVLD